MRADARRNRDRLLASAGALFAAHGLSVSLDEIARHAGVGPGTVHRHFPTKESLVAAVAIDRVRATAAYGRSLLADAEPGAALRALLARMLAEGEVSAPLKSALAGTDFDLRTAAPQASAELREAVAGLLGRAQDAGQVRADLDVDDVMAVVAGVFAALGHGRAGVDPERASRLIGVFFDGLSLGAKT